MRYKEITHEAITDFLPGGKKRKEKREMEANPPSRFPPRDPEDFRQWLHDKVKYHEVVYGDASSLFTPGAGDYVPVSWHAGNNPHTWSDVEPIYKEVRDLYPEVRQRALDRTRGTMVSRPRADVRHPQSDYARY
jgi:hypothetical protein